MFLTDEEKEKLHYASINNKELYDVICDLYGDAETLKLVAKKLLADNPNLKGMGVYKPVYMPGSAIPELSKGIMKARDFAGLKKWSILYDEINIDKK